MRAVLDRYFGLSAAGTTVKRELQAGLTTFLTMAYILFVNPDILSKAIHIDGANVFAQLLTATALAAAIGTLAMGLIARYPFALAPGMGLNAFFTYSTVMGKGVSWQTALGCVFLSSMVFLVFSFSGLREKVIRAFPLTIKRATAAGIGLFLAIIGCVNAGIVVPHPVTLVTIGHLGSGAPLIAMFGLTVTAVLLALKVRGAIMYGIVAASGVAIISGAAVYQGQPFAGFTNGVVATPVWPTDLFLALDLKGAFDVSLIATILAIFFVDFFDTAGTLVGLAEKAGFTDGKGNLPRGSLAYNCDGIATAIGSLFGTSSTTTYIESMAGIEDGGRTGLTAVTVAGLFLLSVCFWPLASAIPSAATAPALIIVGAMMMAASANIDWDDYREAVPAFLTMIGMPLTYSIANGIAFGIVSYTAINALSGKAKQVHWIMYGLSALLIYKFVGT